MNKRVLIDKFASKGYDRQKMVQIGEEIGHKTREEFFQSKIKKDTFSDENVYISTFDTHADLIRKNI